MRIALLPLLLAVLITVALLLWTDGTTPLPSEPLFLRWARVAASHPIRTTLAVFWLALGTLPTRLPRPDFLPKRPEPPRDGTPLKLG
jgi:hypothetical protein